MNTTAFMRRLTESGSNSYAQVFFSRNRLFALLLLGVSFIDLYAGLSGLLAVVVTTVTAFLFGFDESRITSGAYGFNSLLVGLGLGIYYQPSPEFYFVVVLASLLTLFISVAMEGVIGKYYLPYLSIPFILSIWVVLLAAKQFDHLGISERGIYTLNELYGLGGQKLVNFHERMTRFFPVSLRLYFLSLAAIFFQTKIIAGILIAAGLFLYSRIAFTLSLLGFYTAYFFYLLLGVNLAETSYSYIGFNYILTAIAIGGFYLIPSIWSYGWAVLLTPLVAILTLSLDPVFAVFKVPIYALPFNIMVLLFLYVLKFRTGKKKRLTEVVIQHFSPEKTFITISTAGNVLTPPSFTLSVGLSADNGPSHRAMTTNILTATTGVMHGTSSSKAPTARPIRTKGICPPITTASENMSCRRVTASSRPSRTASTTTPWER